MGVNKKITLVNGVNFVVLPDDHPDTCRGSRDFEPHPCQKHEFEVKKIISITYGDSELEKIKKSWDDHFRDNPPPPLDQDALDEIKDVHEAFVQMIRRVPVDKFKAEYLNSPKEDHGSK